MVYCTIWEFADGLTSDTRVYCFSTLEKAQIYLDEQMQSAIEYFGDYMNNMDILEKTDKYFIFVYDNITINCVIQPTELDRVVD